MIALLQIVAKPVTDTISKQVAVIEKPKSDTLEILSKVNEFYDSSWNKLIFLLVGAFTILGIIVPFIIQHFQSKALKASEKQLENEINIRITEAKEEIRKEMVEELSTQMKKYKEEVDFNFDSISGIMVHSQAVGLLEKERFYEALNHFTIALGRYNRCNDKNNIIIILNQIATCLENLTTEEIDRFKSNKFSSLMQRIKATYEKNDLTIIKDKTKELKRKLNAL